MTPTRVRTVIALLLALAGCGGVSAEMRRRSVTRYDLGAALFQEGNEAAALEALFESVRADPENVDAHYLLGTIFLFREDFARSERHFRSCLRLKPRYPEAQNSLGVALIHANRLDEAVEVLRQATGDILYREPHVAWGNLGWAYLRKGNTALAIRALERSVFLQPRFCVGYYRLGDAHYRRHDYDQAARALQRALEGQEQSCQRMQDAHRLLGLTKMHLRDREAAAIAFARCHDLAPETREGRECQQYAQSLRQ